jgi:site-specific DNA-methyltransferase (adenine-specific)
MIKINYNPDILSCLANLSTDEVFTPPHVANSILDLLPNNIWNNKSIKFLDPVSKSGIFLREITKRLMIGLESQIPNANQRINHILKEQVYGISPTELTALLTRRSLYCSKTANNDFSICSEFNDESGNILYKKIEHSWTNGHCHYCGANADVYARSSELENHAYNFIHTHEPERIFNMKFDVIVGNPPYHLSDTGEGVGSSAIYHLFIRQAKKLNPSYLAMIIPSRWFAGGKGLDQFRREMLEDKRISNLVDYPITSDVFPGLKVIGGVCYFLWEKNYNGLCNVTTRMQGQSDSMLRNLDQYDTFVRFNKAISILDKVSLKKYSSLSEKVSTQKPFGLRTYEQPTGKGGITLYANKNVGKIPKANITNGLHMLDKWKILISMGYGEGGETREYPRMILGRPIIAAPNSACTETYIVVNYFDSEKEAKNLDSYLRTKFLRFLVGLRKNTQHITRDRFKFVPDLSMKINWNDEKLFKHFNLSSEEIDFINTIIRPMEAFDEQ